MVEILQKNNDLLANILADAKELVKNFSQLSESDEKFKDYYREIADAGLLFFRLHEKFHKEFPELKNCKIKEYKK
ncbi:chemotaxis protein [uncultured Campylobacter sp.]|uniref:chemotaxis protein n=1 Tax=uncultured Campylobacter sp. TaxID=218934 RepID=UPI002614819F|nr:chemotaxis protein [uncultured Campylobacter sp.]